MTFSSVLKDEIEQYLELYATLGKKASAVQYVFKSLDGYLASSSAASKDVSQGQILEWLGSFQTSGRTRRRKLDVLRGFKKFLASLDLNMSLPMGPVCDDGFEAYVYSRNEIESIFSAADNLTGRAMGDANDTHFEFPSLIRVLYGSGLRLGEALALPWARVDFKMKAIAVVHSVKNGMERLVPMSDCLCCHLQSYRKAIQGRGGCKAYLFENSATGKGYSECTAEKWFGAALDEAGIMRAKENPHKRGPCLHSLRHTFTLESFQKCRREGRPFKDTVMHLAAVLGHSSLSSLEKYLSRNFMVYSENRKVRGLMESLLPKGGEP
jgi:integrase